MCGWTVSRVCRFSAMAGFFRCSCRSGAGRMGKSIPWDTSTIKVGTIYIHNVILPSAKLHWFIKHGGHQPVLHDAFVLPMVPNEIEILVQKLHHEGGNFNASTFDWGMGNELGLHHRCVNFPQAASHRSQLIVLNLEVLAHEMAQSHVIPCGRLQNVTLWYAMI